MNEFSKLQIPNSESAKPNNSKLNNSKSQAKPRITQNSKFLIPNSKFHSQASAALRC